MPPAERARCRLRHRRLVGAAATRRATRSARRRRAGPAPAPPEERTPDCAPAPSTPLPFADAAFAAIAAPTCSAIAASTSGTRWRNFTAALAPAASWSSTCRPTAGCCRGTMRRCTMCGAIPARRPRAAARGGFSAAFRELLEHAAVSADGADAQVAGREGARERRTRTCRRRVEAMSAPPPASSAAAPRRDRFPFGGSVLAAAKIETHDQPRDRAHRSRCRSSFRSITAPRASASWSTRSRPRHRRRARDRAGQRRQPRQ